MQAVISRLAMLRRWAQELGPYLLLEILLPGGTVLALLLFVLRRKGFGAGSIVSRVALTLRLAVAGILEQATAMPQPRCLQPEQTVFRSASPCRIRVAPTDYTMEDCR
ncbi:MAG TPA: hypothetical protein VF814_10505 [Casimicrobiaceae bacterium]